MHLRFVAAQFNVSVIDVRRGISSVDYGISYR